MAWVGDDEITQLRRESEWFRALLRIFAQVTGERPADIVRQIDEIGSDPGFEQWLERSRRQRKKARAAGEKRPEPAGNTPAVG